MSGIWLYLRLVVGTGVVLTPGWLIARGLGVRGVAAMLAWGLTAIAGAFALTFLVSGGIGLTLVLLLATGVVATPAAIRRGWQRPLHGAGAIAAVGALLGLLLWRVAGEVGGDGFFHLARTRKLLSLGDLSLQRVVEFPDGGLHPGYAFPLWHGFLALVAKVAGADPGEVVVHLPSVLMPLVVGVVFEAARLLLGRTAPAAVATAATVAIAGMAPGHGGALTALALPATAARQLLVPAVIVLALAAMRQPDRATLASAGAGSLVLALVHPTYAIFVWLTLAGFVAVRYAWTRLELRAGAAMLVALALPAVAYFLLLIPLIHDTSSVSPSPVERLRALKHYAGQLEIHSPTSYSVSADLFGRTGAVAIAALLLLPLAGFAAKRRWAAFVIGGALAVFVITLIPIFFVPFSDVMSLSQSRRFVGFVPFGIALAGGLGVAAAKLDRAIVPLALATGVLLQLVYPGDFGYSLHEGGPALVTWLAVAGVIGALGYGFLERPPLEASVAVAAVALLFPTYLYGFLHWTPSPARPASALSTGLVDALRHDVPAGGIVYGTPEASYRAAGSAPIYICVAPTGHVADTTDNRPRERIEAFKRFARTGDLAAPEACGAKWIIVDRKRFAHLPALLSDLSVVYQDQRWLLYRL
jgi:hypothetical protein